MRIIGRPGLKSFDGATGPKLQPCGAAATQANAQVPLRIVFMLSISDEVGCGGVDQEEAVTL